MKIKILEKKDQPLMFRQELKLEVEFDNEVPSRKFLMEQVAKATKAKEDLVVIDKIESNFGEKVANVLAHVYTDKAKMDSFVRGYMKKRHEPSEAELKKAKEAEEAKKTAEAKAEEPIKEEVPAVEEKPAKEEITEQKAEDSTQSKKEGE